MRRRFDDGDPYFTSLHRSWSEGTRRCSASCPSSSGDELGGRRRRGARFHRGHLRARRQSDSPRSTRACFAEATRVARVHRGYDAGALAMARDLAASLRAPLVASTVSRLLVDLNRSLGHPRAWSAATRPLQFAEEQCASSSATTAALSQGRGHRRRSRGARTPGDPCLFAQLHAGAGRARCAPPTSDCCTTPRGPARPRSSALWKAALRRARPRLARAPQLSLCRKGRRTDAIPAAAIPGLALRRHRARDQPGVRARWRQAVAATCAQSVADDACNRRCCDRVASASPNESSARGARR